MYTKHVHLERRKVAIYSRAVCLLNRLKPEGGREMEGGNNLSKRSVSKRRYLYYRNTEIVVSQGCNRSCFSTENVKLWELKNLTSGLLWLSRRGNKLTNIRL